MKRIGYSDLEAHRSKHYQLIQNLNNKIIAFSLNDVEPAAILDFLVDWFLSHTASEDTKFVQFEKGRVP